MIYFILFIIAYSWLLFWWNRRAYRRLNYNYSRFLINSHYCVLIICVVISFINLKYSLDLKGIWTTRIIIITLIITGILIPFIVKERLLGKTSKIYFKVFSWLPLFASALAIIPYMGLIIIISLVGKLLDPYHKLYYQDDKLRVQSTFTGALGSPRLDVFQKKTLFEKHLYRSDFISLNIDSLKVHYDMDSTRIVIYKNTELFDKITTVSLTKVK